MHHFEVRHSLLGIWDRSGCSKCVESRVLIYIVTWKKINVFFEPESSVYRIPLQNGYLDFKSARKKYFQVRKKNDFFPRHNINQYSRFHTFRTSRTVPITSGSIFRPKPTSLCNLFGEGFICSSQITNFDL